MKHYGKHSKEVNSLYLRTFNHATVSREQHEQHKDLENSKIANSRQ